MVKGYSFTQIRLHWLVAGLIFFQLIFSDGMSEAWRTFERTGTTTVTTMAWAHIIGGSLVLALVAWRLILRFTRGAPGAPEGLSPLVKLAGEAGHWALYALMVAMPVTGLMAWFGGITSVSGLHAELLKVILWVVIITHIAAALWHQFIRKDGLLLRMRKPLD